MVKKRSKDHLLPGQLSFYMGIFSAVFVLGLVSCVTVTSALSSTQTTSTSKLKSLPIGQKFVGKSNVRRKYTHVFNRRGPTTPPPIHAMPLSQLQTLPVEPSRLQCPYEDDMWPCQCSTVMGRDLIHCTGYNVTQKSLEDSLQALRHANTVQNDDADFEILNITRFVLEKTDLVSLDLTPFSYMNFEFFSITHNPYLSQLTVSKFPGAPIGAKNLDLSSNALTDVGLSTGKGHGNIGIFQYFATSVHSLDLSGNRLQGTKPKTNSAKYPYDSEFLPGFSTLTNLQDLYLQMNQITRIGGGQFLRNTKLRRIDLYKNGLEELGPLAFALEQKVKSKQKVKGQGQGQGQSIDRNYGAQNKTDGLVIDLSWNRLTDDRIDPENGLDLTGRVTRVLLKGNKMNTLSLENFQSFLLKNPENYLDLQFNDWFCDERMSWLKEQRDEYEKRTVGINCVNDLGKTIFSSALFL